MTDTHPLPELLNSVLNDGKEWSRDGGWEVRRLEQVVTIGTYDDPPESGGHITNKAVFQP